MKRGILIIGGLVIIGIAGVAYYLYVSLDGFIREAVEIHGSEITRTEVTLDRVAIDPVSGRGRLEGLKIGNPEGFETPSAVELGAFSIELDMATILSDPVVIKEIVIDEPGVTYELGAGGSNIDALRRNVDAYMAEHGRKQRRGGGRKLIIENLYIRDGTVTVSAEMLQGETASAPLPDIHLKDIGKAAGGATPAEVAELIMESVADGAAKAVADLGIEKSLEGLKKSLEDLGDRVGKKVGEATKGLGDSIGKAAKEIGKKIGSGLESAGKKLKDVLGN